MYDGIKKALRSTQTKTAPFKSTTGEVIIDQGRQMDRRKERYSDFYSRKNTVASSAIDAIECMLVMQELAAEPTIGELKAIDSLAAGKAPGSDSIPSRPNQTLQGYPTAPLAWSLLPVLERGSGAARHERRQDRNPI